MTRAFVAGTPLLLLLTLTAPGFAATEPVPKQEFPVPAPPLSDGIFPCSDCHVDLVPDPTPRELGMHEEIVARFHHAQEQRWCLDCHNPDDRDRLRLANGQLIGFEESYRLCGQCHGEIYRDWKAGVHGKRTGYWNGAKQYRLCVNCHDPHNPRFAPLVPEPAPRRPEAIKHTDRAAIAPVGHGTDTSPGSE